MIDCRDFERGLESWLEGTLPPAARRACDRHLAACPTCRELALLGGLDPTAEPQPVPESLLPAILDRTSGPACRALEESLIAHLEGALDEAENELIELHLQGCAPCQGLVAQLATLDRDLPRLAEIDPGPGFVDSVLAATLPPAVRLRRWWQREWPRWVRRPRFSWELAYVATLGVVLVVGLPNSPAGAVPGQILEIARTDPLERLAGPAEALEERAERQLATLKSSKVGQTIRELPHLAEQAGEEGSARLRATARRLGTFWEQAASLLTKAGEDRSPAPDPTPEPTDSTEEIP